MKIRINQKALNNGCVYTFENNIYNVEFKQYRQGYLITLQVLNHVAESHYIIDYDKARAILTDILKGF